MNIEMRRAALVVGHYRVSGLCLGGLKPVLTGTGLATGAALEADEPFFENVCQLDTRPCRVAFGSFGEKKLFLMQ